jgi:hypothetical protein
MMMGLAPTPPARQAQSPRWHPLGSPPQGKIHHTGQDFTSFLGWGSIQTTLYAEIQGRDRPEPYEYVHFSAQCAPFCHVFHSNNSETQGKSTVRQWI